jgi:hypothetical protein
MAKYLVNLDLNQNQLVKARVENLASAPSGPVTGQIYYNTASNAMFFYNGSSWIDASGDLQGLTASTGLSGGGTTGTVSIALADTAVSAGSYGSATQIPTYTVDAQGRLTAAANTTVSVTSSSVSDFTEAVQDTAGAQVATNGSHTGISASYDDAGDGAIDLALTTSGVTAASYGSATQVPTYTVDTYGRLTAAANIAIAVPSSGISDFTEAVQDVAGGMVTGNTETGITVTYQDADGTLDFVNNGVTSVAGTSNEVDVSASTGAVTIGLPSDVTIGNNLTVSGDLTVSGTTTTIDSTTITVDDKNLELGSVASPSDATADGGGITLKGATDKTMNWVNSTDAWTSSEHMELASGKAFYINGTSVLNATTLGSGVTGSSLTSLGTIGTGTWEATDIGVAHGGTGASTAATARSNLGATTKVSSTIGDGSATSIAVTHSLNTDDVVVEVYDASSKETVICDVDRTSVNAVTLDFASAPATNAYRVVVIG